MLLSIDHHRGSEENQPGWDYHEPDLVDPTVGRIDTLTHWRRSIAKTGLESSVVGVVGDSPTMASLWDRPLCFCFIDGGHGAEPAWADFRGWSPRVADGGWLAIHDVFPDPADGGRPPFELYRAALESENSPTTAPAGACAYCDGRHPGADRAQDVVQAASGATWASGVLGAWSPVKRATSATPAATASTASTQRPQCVDGTVARADGDEERRGGAPDE